MFIGFGYTFQKLCAVGSTSFLAHFFYIFRPFDESFCIIVRQNRRLLNWTCHDFMILMFCFQSANL